MSLWLLLLTILLAILINLVDNFVYDCENGCELLYKPYFFFRLVFAAGADDF